MIGGGTDTFIFKSLVAFMPSYRYEMNLRKDGKMITEHKCPVCGASLISDNLETEKYPTAQCAGCQRKFQLGREDGERWMEVYYKESTWLDNAKRDQKLIRRVKQSLYDEETFVLCNSDDEEGRIFTNWCKTAPWPQPDEPGFYPAKINGAHDLNRWKSYNT